MLKKSKFLAFTLVLILLISVIAVARFFTKEKIKEETVEKIAMLDTHNEKDIQEVAKDEEIIDVEEETINNNEPVIEIIVKNPVAEQENKEVQEKVTENKQERRDQNVSSRSVTVTTVYEEPRTQIVEQEENNEQEGVPSAYCGYSTIGKIEISRTGLNLPILDRQTAGGMKVAPCFSYSTGSLNYSGKTLIMGHNYNNGKLFSNNYRIQIGDEIYVTTLDGNRVRYVVYDKRIVSPSDVSYLEEDSYGPEILLSTCTDNDDERLLILARKS